MEKINEPILRLANQTDLLLIQELFMELHTKVIESEVDRNKVGFVIHTSIRQKLCVIMYKEDDLRLIPIGYTMGRSQEALWSFNREVLILSTYVFDEYRKTNLSKKMLRFWAKKARLKGKIVW